MSDFSPTVNTREGEYSFHIDADLPGVKKEEEVKDEDYYKVETSFGKFQRSFTLPSDVDSENITAVTNNGVSGNYTKIRKKENTKRIEIK